jgi:DNA invertase Pin-like site-specific DNA recombinase
MTPAINTEEGTIRAYRRISVTTEESGALERQQHDIARWRDYRRPGAAIVDYADEGISGAKGKRLKNRQKLLREIEPGDALVATKVDRLARNVRDLLEIVRHCEDIGAAVVFTEQNISTEGPYGKFMIVMLAALAELERDVVGERIQAARKAFNRSDRYGIGRLPFGWHAVKDEKKGYLVRRPITEDGPCARCEDKDGHPVVHHREGTQLREAILAVIDGETMKSQSEKLGLTHQSVFSWLCRNTQLYGQPAENGTIEDPESAIISKAEWVQLQDLLIQDRSWTRADGYGAALFCSTCDKRLYYNRHRHKYRCQSPHRPRPTVSRRIADEFIEREFLARYGDKPVMHIVTDDDSERQERLAEVTMELNEVTEMLKAPGADIPMLANKIQELHWERESIQMYHPKPKGDIRPLGITVAELWEKQDDEARCAIINQAVKIKVHQAGREGGRHEIVPLTAGPLVWTARDKPQD